MVPAQVLSVCHGFPISHHSPAFPSFTFSFPTLLQTLKWSVSTGGGKHSGLSGGSKKALTLFLCQRVTSGGGRRCWLLFSPLTQL